MTSFAQQERTALADLMLAVGPDAPTLCGDWDAYDLAAHLVARERRPDSAAGILVPAFASWTDRVRRGLRAKHSFDELVGLVRSGPPKLSFWSLPGADETLNMTEFFIHHEDVRRAQPDWVARDLPSELEKALWVRIRSSAKIALRKAPTGVTVVTGPRSFVAKEREPMVTVSGPPGELTLYVSGRQRVAQVETGGAPDAVATLATASLGF